MLVTFCLRLATGLVAALLLLSPAQVNPRFYRTHFLTALGLTAVPTFLAWSEADVFLRWALIACLTVSFLGSLIWSLHGAPGGRVIVAVAVAALATALALVARGQAGAAQGDYRWRLLDDFSSAALLGTATTAMLMGHSYLIAPAMSLTPLTRLLGGLAASTVVRLLIAAVGLWAWTEEHSLANLGDVTVLWLPLRWGLGLIGPLVLGWMAWQAARIRSTQSATGILYVVVIFSFLGELTSQLIASNTGSIL